MLRYSGAIMACYSIYLCLKGTVLSIRAACPDGDFIMPCYSPSCIRNNWESFGETVFQFFSANSGLLARKTREKVTCRNVLRSKEIDATKKKKEIPGEDIPFPFPKPHKFTSVSGKQSLLILPRK